MEQDVVVMVAAGSNDTIELDEATQKEFIHIIKSSLSGHKLTDREVNMLFFWARHQNAPEFNFVPEKYRAVSSTKPIKKTVKKGK